MRDEMVEINGQRLHVTDTGGQGAVLLFAHGNQMDNSMWSRVIDLLRNDFRCIAVGCCAFRAGIAVTGSSLFQEWIGWLHLDDHIGLAEFLRTSRPAARLGLVRDLVQPNRFGVSIPDPARSYPAVLRPRSGGGPWGGASRVLVFPPTAWDWPSAVRRYREKCPQVANARRG